MLNMLTQLPNMGQPDFRTPPIVQQNGPRAQYEQQSRLQELLMANAMQSGGGWAGALGQIANAYQAKKMGEKAEGSLSAALAAEAEREQAEAIAQARAAAEQRQRDFEDFIRKEDYKRNNAAAPELIRSMQEAGIDPRSPEGQRRILQGTGPQAVTNVNTGQQGPQFGTIPSGFQLMQGEDGSYRMAPIPGGPADIEAQQTEQAGETKVATERRYGNVVTEDIDRALGLLRENPNAAGWGGLLASVPGTDAKRMGGFLDTVQAATGFDRLQAMRDSSPTGGALGAVSEREMDFLKASLGNLENTQDAETLGYNLARIKNIYLDTVHGNANQRAELVRRGAITPEQNTQIEAGYEDLGNFSLSGQRGQTSLDELLRKYGG